MLFNVLKYIHYRIYCFYSRWGEDTPAIFASGIMAATECANILLIVYVWSYYQDFNFSFSYWQIFFFLGSLVLVNHLLLKNTYQESELKWGSEDPGVKETRGAVIFGYFLFSIIFLIAWVTYAHNQKG